MGSIMLYIVVYPVVLGDHTSLLYINLIRGEIIFLASEIETSQGVTEYIVITKCGKIIRDVWIRNALTSHYLKILD